MKIELRRVVALGLLAVLAGLSWATIGPGRARELVLVLLGGFALRIVLMRTGVR